jgi:hypothetical protein
LQGRAPRRIGAVHGLPIRLEEQFHVEPFGYAGEAALLIAIRLTPLVFVDNFGERYPPHRPESAHLVADRQQSVRMYIGWQPERVSTSFSKFK